MSDQGDYRATGFRMRAEGGDGGGATWENEVEVILDADEIRFIETQIVEPPGTKSSSIRVEDVGDARLGSDSLKIRVRRRKWWHHIVKLLDDPPKIEFSEEQAQAFRELTSELVKRIR